VLLFNNGLGGTEQNFSSADELVLPVQPDGTYAREAGKAFGPEQLYWTFEDPGKLFSPRISGAQRLPNGNTLICSGTQHLLLEVTNEAKIAWLYQNPPRFHKPLSADGQTLDENSVAPADLPEDTLNALRTEFGIPLEDGGTMFQAHRYPPDYPAFVGRDLTPKIVPSEVMPADAKSQPAVPSKDTPSSDTPLEEKEMPSSAKPQAAAANQD
jgi:hypothetical protein